MAVNIITPRRREDFFDDKGDPTLRFIRWVELVTGQTNTTTVEVESADVAEKYPWPTNQTIDEATGFNYPAIETTVSDIRAVTVTSNYTAVDGDFINAKSNAQITFPKYPEENSVIIVRNGDGSTIKLLGNGKNMNGESTGQLTRKGTSIEFHYFIDSDEWFAR